MKSGTIENPKTKRLARALGVPRCTAIGILESLWHFTASQCPRGNVGRFSDEDIAEAVFWEGDASALISALVECRWLDRSEEFRLIVHHWCDHADDRVNMKLARSLDTFACGKEPSTKRLSHEERRKLEEEKRIKSAQCKDSVRTESAQGAHVEQVPSALPLPRPCPPPIPITSLCSDLPATPQSKPVVTKIVLNRETWAYEGVTDQDFESWAEAYPAVDLKSEIRRSIEWVRSNPAKGKKNQWRKFITGWLGRCQERGGTKGYAGRESGEASFLDHAPNCSPEVMAAIADVDLGASEAAWQEKARRIRNGEIVDGEL